LLLFPTELKNMIQNPLFIRKGELRNCLEQRKSELKNEIESIEPNYMLNVSVDNLSKYLLSKYSLDSPSIVEDKIYVYNQSEVDIDVKSDRTRFIPDRSRPFYIRGISVTIAIPFYNDGSFFEYRPSTFNYSPPLGQIIGQEVHLTYEKVEHIAEELKETYEKDVNEIKQYLEWVKRDIDSFNQSLESFAKQNITQRKKKLIDAQGMVAGLGIPIKRRDDAQKTYTLPEIRRKPKFELPKVETKAFEYEPTLPIEEYEHILNIIQNMVMVMERSPRAFANMEEEDLRQHFLVQLNGHYEGQATGETFNFDGKTDILIRVKNKNIFIAECKFWKGEKEFVKAIDQLLGYTCWRDTKIALLIFNKNKDFSLILKKIQENIKFHACYESEHGKKEETIFQYLFHQPSDTSRKLILTVMAFNIPS